MINIDTLQRRLIAKGYDIGARDGVAGPLTMAAYLAYVAGRPMSALLALGAGAAAHFPRYGLLDSPARLANFVGQAAHESAGFRQLVEVWGPDHAQAGYEGRADLGNTVPGDGFRFRGRGLFQLTGRENYHEMGARLDLGLVDHPDLAADPGNAILTACEFWHGRGLSELADAGGDDTITRRINGGTNGIDNRRRLVALAKGILA